MKTKSTIKTPKATYGGDVIGGSVRNKGVFVLHSMSRMKPFNWLPLCFSLARPQKLRPVETFEHQQGILEQKTYEKHGT